jgi:hypothetical protein
MTAAYGSNDDKDWINEHNQPNPADKTMPYGDQDVQAIKLYSDAGKMLKKLFYDIQQTSYYCDFTLESAQFSFEKVRMYDESRAILAERRAARKHWEYILKE